MNKFLAFSVSLFFLFSLNSCFFSGVEGNGHVIREKRNIQEAFKGISVKQGINVELTRGDEIKLQVAFDENLLPLLVTEVSDSILQVYFSENVGKRTKSTLYLTVPEIQKISTSSGASVASDTTFTAMTTALEASSGSVIRMPLQSSQITIDCSSGANVAITGTTDKLNCNASSGSIVETSGLEAKQVNGTASSGAIMSVRALNQLQAEASSGGHITYEGNPQEKSIHKSSGGNVDKKE